MRGRHVDAPTGHGRRVSRWAALAIATGVAASVALATAAPAAAANTDAQLSFTGVVSAKYPTGGTTVAVKPGDTVTFKPAIVPTQGLDALGLGSLGDQLNSLLKILATEQILVHLPATFPGGKRDIILGAGGKAAFTATFPAAGTFPFTYEYRQVGLLGLTNPLLTSTQLNQLKSVGIALNASNQFVGQVLVSTNPPPGGISVQLPSVGVQPSLPVVGNLPSLGLPGVTLPTIGVPIPSVPRLPLPTLIPSPKNNGSGTATLNFQYTPQNYPQTKVVPSGGACCGDVIGSGVPLPGFGGVPGAGSGDAGFGGLLDPGVLAGGNAVTGAAIQPGATDAAQAKAKTQAIEPRANIAPTGQLPVILAILAIIALSLVTATYARLYLLRRDS